MFPNPNLNLFLFSYGSYKPLDGCCNLSLSFQFAENVYIFAIFITWHEPIVKYVIICNWQLNKMKGLERWWNKWKKLRSLARKIK